MWFIELKKIGQMNRLNLRYLIIIFAVLFTKVGFSQENEGQEEIKKSIKTLVLSSVIEMDIDKSIFPLSEENAHFTEDKKSGIVAMLMPSPFDDLEKELKSKEGSSIIDKGELKNEGKRILFIKESYEREGQFYYMIMFAKEYTDEATLMVSSVYESSKDEDYMKYAERAVKSAKIIEKE